MYRNCTKHSTVSLGQLSRPSRSFDVGPNLDNPGNTDGASMIEVGSVIHWIFAVRKLEVSMVIINGDLERVRKRWVGRPTIISIVPPALSNVRRKIGNCIADVREMLASGRRRKRKWRS